MTIYIQRRDGRHVETVDEFETRKEARAMRDEYQFADPSAIYYTSTRACRDWHQAEPREETQS